MTRFADVFGADSLTPEEQVVVDRFVDAHLLTSNQVAPAHHSGELAVGRQAGTQHVAGTAPTARGGGTRGAVAAVATSARGD